MTPQQRVWRLETFYGADFTNGFELIERKVGYADGADFSLVFKIRQCPHGFFQRHSPATEGARRPVDLVMVQVIGSQVLQGAVAGRDHLVVLEMIGEHLGQDYHLVTPGADSLAQHLFRVAVTIDLGGVEGGDARIHGCQDGFFTLRIIDAGPHGFTGLPGAHDDRGKLDRGPTQYS
jgi:hypothetical protein